MNSPINHQSCANARAMYIIIVVLLSGALSACAPYLGDTDAALALEDIAVGTGDSRLKANTTAPARSSVNYTSDGLQYRGDLYLPAGRIRAGIVLVPGVVPEGKDDVRLVALAHTLARMEFAVLVPDLQGLRKYKVRKSDIREVADAFRYLVSNSAWVPDGRAGIAGFSYGAGPVLLAALEPDIRKQVRFVFTLGGYYDLQTIATYFTTGYFREHGKDNWLYAKPNPYIKWVFALSNIELLDRSEDRDKLRVLLAGVDKHVHLSNKQLSELGPDARSLYALLVNREPLRVRELLNSLPRHMRYELEGINPASRDLSQLEARVILLHGRGDTMIPYTESIALARAIPPEQVQLFLIDGFAHVDIHLEQRDISLLLAAMEALLKQRSVIP